MIILSHIIIDPTPHEFILTDSGKKIQKHM